jgi:hypothetical protein
MFCFHKTVAGLPHSHKLDQLSVPSYPHQAEVKFSIHSFDYQFCQGGGGGVLQTSHQQHWTIQFPSEQMMCHSHLVELQLHSALGRQRQAVQEDSVSTSYGEYRKSQMLVELVLQFSALCFSQERRKEAPPQQKEKWPSSGQVGHCWPAMPGLPGAIKN